MAEHAWCRSPSRDEAVRAAEDGREGPLPTLAEAIAAVTDRRPVEPGGGGNVTGLRTERVTLDAKLAPAANADGGSNHAAPAASGAAGAEPYAWGVRWDGQTEIDCEFVYNNSSGVHELLANNSGSGTVVPLYAAPQPAPGWLTEEERRSIQHAANLAKASWSYSVAQELENILARSSPPEVVLRSEAHSIIYADNKNANRVFRAKDVIEALAAVGVTVKEVGRE